MSAHFRPYSGSLPYAAGLAKSLADWLSQEVPDTARRLWTENDANAVIVENVTRIRADIARAQRALREIENTFTTAEEEQDAAKEVISRDAA
jgi:hypothetical protein